MADPWVRPTSPGPPDPGVPSPSEEEARAQLERTPGPDDYLLIDRLREDATSGRMDLSSILSEATHAARYFADATGAALALWSQGVVICRARSGDRAGTIESLRAARKLTKNFESFSEWCEQENAFAELRGKPDFKAIAEGLPTVP